MNKVISFLFEQLEEAKLLSGGPLRAKMGTIVEDFVDQAWAQLSKKYPNVSAEIKVGSKSPITIYNSFKESVDRHCYINGELVLAIECKTYLDKCYLQRADSDFNLMKGSKHFFSCILSLQNSVNEDTLKYFLSRGNIDEVFFFSDKKRDSQAENHICRNPQFLDEEKILIFLNKMEDFFVKASSIT